MLVRSSAMSEDAFSISIRKFLKEVGVTSQRRIEETVRERQISGKKLEVRMTLRRKERASPTWWRARSNFRKLGRSNQAKSTRTKLKASRSDLAPLK
jgi:hypothetical protein